MPFPWKGRDVAAFLVSLVIIGAGAVFLLAWWDHFQERNQPLVQARPYVYQSDVPFRVALLWEEKILTAPMAGTVSFPRGRGPTRVAKGDLVAVVSGQGGARRVYAPSPGYFAASVDGLEGSWRYADLWLGEKPLPPGPARKAIAEGTLLGRGDPLGIFVPQPQELRAIGYIDSLPAVAADMARGFVRLRLRQTDLPFQAPLRVFRDLGGRFKVYLTLPLFPPYFLDGRLRTFILSGEERKGVILPETSVVHRRGTLGVFTVQGQTVAFREIKGIPVPGKQFLVTEGLHAGEIVAARGSRAKEGTIRLW